MLMIYYSVGIQSSPKARSDWRASWVVYHFSNIILFMLHHIHILNILEFWFYILIDNKFLFHLQFQFKSNWFLRIKPHGRLFSRT